MIPVFGMNQPSNPGFPPSAAAVQTKRMKSLPVPRLVTSVQTMTGIPTPILYLTRWTKKTNEDNHRLFEMSQPVTPSGRERKDRTQIVHAKKKALNEQNKKRPDQEPGRFSAETQQVTHCFPAHSADCENAVRRSFALPFFQSHSCAHDFG